MIPKKIIFTTPAETLRNLRLTYRLNNVIDEVAAINEILMKSLPELNGRCRCGSIDLDNSEMVILVNDNGTFYKFNQQIELFKDSLVVNCRFYDKILVKVNPNKSQDATNHRPHYLDERQIESWNKIAASLGREPIEPKVVPTESAEHQWQIKL